MELATGYKTVSVFLAAIDLDVFTLLHKKPRGAQDMADSTGSDARAMSILLDALSATGIIRKKNDIYSVDEETASLLSSEGDESLWHMMNHNCHLFTSWARLAETVRTGGPVVPSGRAARQKKSLKAFIGAMHDIGRMRAADATASLELSGVKRILDVGAGPGTYTMEFLKRNKTLNVTHFDLPEVTSIAQEYIANEGLSDRVVFESGDFENDELPGNHDLAWVSAIIHQQGRKENRALFEKIYRALVPSGRIIVRDHILDPDRTGPAPAALFAVNMLVRTKTGGCFTFDEVREDLESAGFREVEQIKTDIHMNGLVHAIR